MFEIKRAERKGSKICIALMGESGSGKTYSALRLARGLVGEKGKIGVIDTEQKRASLYADCFGGFDVIDIDAPYSPARYIEAIKAFKDAGYNCLIIDSMSREWEDEGGVLWQADHCFTSSGKKRKDIGVWAEPKAQHRMLMTTILNSGMHIILCYRVKFPMEPKENEKGAVEMVKGDAVPVWEPNSDYDITVKLMMDKETKVPTISQKCPEGIEYLFTSGTMITEDTGRGIIEWLDSRQRDKDAIIEEGIHQKDLRAWFKTLNASECSLARKYASEIKAKQVAEPEVEQPEFQDVEEL